MQQSIFDRMLDEIYSAFGRERPKYGSAPYRSLWRRVVEERAVPDDAAKAIAYALSEYDSLPTNLGKAVLGEFEKWLEKYPQHKKQNQQNGCHQCSADVLGFFWAQGPDGMGKMFKCACNRQREFEHISGYTHAAVERQGYAIITDQGFYMRQVLAAMADDDATNKAVQIKPAMLSLQRVDREKEYRMRQLPDREQQAYAEAINV